ncbi:MAG: hypothetical protein EXX96DRAFT_566587 [Benjaminiella poitrasii]|nr:MAG: hypothetical protein EXX96DRAFT_566587 [Benjaminiella poitrasii]
MAYQYRDICSQDVCKEARRRSITHFFTQHPPLDPAYYNPYVYHYETPPRKKKVRRPYKLKRSASTGILAARNKQEDNHYNEEYDPTTISADDMEYLKTELGKIDYDCYTKEDGEPMNDLELLATENAILNTRKCKSNTLFQHEKKEKQGISDLVESLSLNDAPTESNAGAITEGSLIVEAYNIIQPSAEEKKKGWLAPFKKSLEETYSKAKKQINLAAKILAHPEPMTVGSSIPIPVLSPASTSSSIISSSSLAISTPSPNHFFLHQQPQQMNAMYSDIKPEGVHYWYFQDLSSTSSWIPFDLQNQQKIINHIQYNRFQDMLMLVDSHFRDSQVPIYLYPLKEKLITRLLLGLNSLHL